MAAASACQPFQEGEQHLPLRHGGSVLPPVNRGTALPLRQASSVPPPDARELLPPPSSSGRSATEARALKVHSEAERRRRERINAHLAALRRMIPDARQMDKATLLARVVCQLKDLKRKAAETRQPQPIPAEANGITVDCYTAGAAAGGYGRPATYIRACVSCDDRPGLLADLAGAFRGLRLRPTRADMASLGGRARCEFMLCREEGDVGSAGRVKALEAGVRQALTCVAFPETAYGCNYRSRRQRVLESHYALGHELGVGDHRGW
ncbi:hypothetical protein PAHAL_3G132100 [Panicum hallii]|uniref:BHLH domain-containing protein n=1 Tax=Panicum hallii TaxID=206008 RepID=A0A2T8KI48_9POAL|nr:transcription factor bHLH51-like [Panicum hallii]PAN17447.1 hypothetical protein PAHAL_3G132100 [Panicum hallii]PVH61824.1 hypothetical protein PAHAL_3G132100 [Panicum hallii]